MNSFITATSKGTLGMIKQYVTQIRNNGGKLPRDYADDPSPMKIAKLSDKLHKVKAKAGKKT